MSLQFWHTKLYSSYVIHDGKYKQITELKTDKPPQAGVLGPYPEEYLPYIKFSLDGEEWVGYEDFQIRFPREQYKVIDNHAVFGSRHMRRAYTLGPSTDAYSLSNQRVTFDSWIKAPCPEYSDPELLMDWRSNDLVFDASTACKRSGMNTKHIFYEEAPLLELRRTKGQQELKTLKDGLPEEFYQPWVKHLGIVRYRGEVEEGDDGRQLNHYWVKMRDYNTLEATLTPYSYTVQNSALYCVFDGYVRGCTSYDYARHYTYGKEDVFEDVMALRAEYGIDDNDNEGEEDEEDF